MRILPNDVLTWSTEVRISVGMNSVALLFTSVCVCMCVCICFGVIFVVGIGSNSENLIMKLCQKLHLLIVPKNAPKGCSKRLLSAINNHVQYVRIRKCYTY